MSAPRPVGRPLPHWRKLYEDAILELDIAKIPRRIEDARKAIQSAIVELSSHGKNEDCKQLLDALTVMDDLLKMYKQRTPSREQ
jgi:hypothetical protein